MMKRHVTGHHLGKHSIYHQALCSTRIGEARTKLIGIEENDNGQDNGSMVN